MTKGRKVAKQTKLPAAKDEAARWKPVRRGRIYCSPACGGDCTLAVFRAATAAAEKLAVKLGEGWEPRVWENLGWHWEVLRGEIAVRFMPFSRVYVASFGSLEAGLYASAEHRLPREAVRLVIAKQLARAALLFASIAAAVAEEYRE